MFSLPQLALPAELCAADGGEDIQRLARSLRSLRSPVSGLRSPVSSDAIHQALHERLAPILGCRWWVEAECTFHSKPFSENPELAGFIFRDPHDNWQILPIAEPIVSFGELIGSLILGAFQATNTCGNWLFQPCDFLYHIEAYHWQHEDGPTQWLDEIRHHAALKLIEHYKLPKPRGTPLYQVLTTPPTQRRRQPSPVSALRSPLSQEHLIERATDPAEIKQAKWTLRATDQELCDSESIPTWATLEKIAPRWFWDYGHSERKLDRTELKHALARHSEATAAARLAIEILDLRKSLPGREKANPGRPAVDDRHDHFEELSWYSAPVILHGRKDDGLLHHFDVGANDSANSGDDMHTFSAIFFDSTKPAEVRNAFKRLDTMVAMLSRVDQLLTILSKTRQTRTLA